MVLIEEIADDADMDTTARVSDEKKELKGPRVAAETSSKASKNVDERTRSFLRSLNLDEAQAEKIAQATDELQEGLFGLAW